METETFNLDFSSSTSSISPLKDANGPSITLKQAEKIAQEKMKDLNAFDLKEATKIICGSARSMGIEVKDKWRKNFQKDTKKY